MSATSHTKDNLQGLGPCIHPHTNRHEPDKTAIQDSRIGAPPVCGRLNCAPTSNTGKFITSTERATVASYTLISARWGLLHWTLGAPSTSSRFATLCGMTCTSKQHTHRRCRWPAHSAAALWLHTGEWRLTLMRRPSLDSGTHPGLSLLARTWLALLYRTELGTVIARSAYTRQDFAKRRSPRA